MARWLMPNDFAAEVGRRFTFRTKPMGDWDGVVHCEVIELVPHRKLVYSWKGGSRTNTKYGSSLDTVVTWTLAPVAGGTRLRMVHAGSCSPDNDVAFDAMSPVGPHPAKHPAGDRRGRVAATGTHALTTARRCT